jgi:chromosome partitioning protein
MPDIVQEFINFGANESKSELLNNREYILKGKEVDLIPSSIKLATIESQLIIATSRENVLKKLIRRIQDDYDFILLDTMPSLSIMTINALVAADEVLIPVQPQFFSAKGLELLFETIENIKGELNPKLKIAGVLVTMYSDRINIHREIVKSIEEAFKEHLRIFDIKIPVSIKATESQTLSMSIFEHDPSSKLAESYSLFTSEFLCEK